MSDVTLGIALAFVLLCLDVLLVLLLRQRRSSRREAVPDGRVEDGAGLAEDAAALAPRAAAGGLRDR